MIHEYYSIHREFNSRFLLIFKATIFASDNFICADRQTDRQTHTQTDRQTDRTCLTKQKKYDMTTLKKQLRVIINTSEHNSVSKPHNTVMNTNNTVNDTNNTVSDINTVSNTNNTVSNTNSFLSNTNTTVNNTPVSTTATRIPQKDYGRMFIYSLTKRNMFRC